MKTRVGSLGRLADGLSKGGRRYVRPTLRTIKVPAVQVASAPGNSDACSKTIKPPWCYDETP